MYDSKNHEADSSSKKVSINLRLYPFLPDEKSVSQRETVRPSSETDDGQAVVFALNSSCIMQLTVRNAPPFCPLINRSTFLPPTSPLSMTSPSAFSRDSCLSLSQNKRFVSLLVCIMYVVVGVDVGDDDDV